jgi:glucose-6-phosphate isomerase
MQSGNTRLTAAQRQEIFQEFQAWYNENSEQLNLKNLLKNPAHADKFVLQNEGFILDYSKQHINDEAFAKLQNIAQKFNIQQDIQSMFSGEVINRTEGRAVLHTALRAPKDAVINVNGENVVPHVHAELDKIYEFVDKVRSGEIVGVTGKRIKTILSVGIGGSYLGNLSAYLAFKNTKEGFKSSRDYNALFLADPDPQDFHTQVDSLDVESTLVIILSKSFTTAETMLNANTAREWVLKSLQNIDSNLSDSEIIAHHFAAVSTNLERTGQFGIPAERVFQFWNWVGGRFSVSSAIGVLSLGIVFGKEVVQQFLKGMNDIDENFKTETDPKKNISLLLGLIGFYNRTIEGYSNRSILPYNQGLKTFFNHIQQVSMESNGKRVDQNGDVVPYDTGYIVYGESGTKG